MKDTAILIENKKAKIRFTVVETFSAGMELLGSEVKSLREKHGSLDGARVIIRGGGAFLVGMTIPPYQGGSKLKDYDESRSRRLLLAKKEIAELADAESKKGLTIVPFEVYNNRHVKVRIAIVRGKSKVDRREDIKARDAKREASRVLKRK